MEIKRSLVFKHYKEFAEASNIADPASNQMLYRGIRELKLCISEVQVNGLKCFAFDPRAVYQECIQLGYDSPEFALEGYKKETEIVDDRPFDPSEFQNTEEAPFLA